MLKKLGVVKSKNKGYRVFMEHIEPNFLNNTMRPSEYVTSCWEKYEASDIPKNNALNGTIFELIISTLLIKESIMPLFLQAKVAFVPNVSFDAVLYSSDSGPIGISLKTSLRERYKQADLEAIALKYVHRKAENYLLTMNEEEANLVSEKISRGEVMGLNKAILTSSEEFNVFIDALKRRTFIEPGNIEIISSTVVITSNTVENAIR